MFFRIFLALKHGHSVSFCTDFWVRKMDVLWSTCTVRWVTKKISWHHAASFVNAFYSSTRHTSCESCSPARSVSSSSSSSSVVTPNYVPTMVRLFLDFGVFFYAVCLRFTSLHFHSYTPLEPVSSMFVFLHRAFSAHSLTVCAAGSWHAAVANWLWSPWGEC